MFKDDNANPFAILKQENNIDNIEAKNLLEYDYLKIQTEKSIENSQKNSISKNNLDKIIKINMENKIFSDKNLILKENCYFDNNFFSLNFFKLKSQLEYDIDLVESLLNVK